jgi:hypothetical protein
MSETVLLSCHPCDWHNERLNWASTWQATSGHDAIQKSRNRERQKIYAFAWRMIFSLHCSHP